MLKGEIDIPDDSTPAWLKRCCGSSKGVEWVYCSNTYVLVWALDKPERLFLTVRQELEDPLNELYFSAASIWEIGLSPSSAR